MNFHGNKFVFFLIVSVLLSCTVPAQDNNSISALKQKLLAASSDTQKVRLYLEITEICPEIDIKDYVDSALAICNKKIPFTQGSEKNKFEKFKSLALNNLGIFYQALGKNIQALEVYDSAKVLAMKSGDSIAWADALNNLAIIYESAGNNMLALEYMFKSISLIDSASHTSKYALYLNSTGSVYLDLHKPKTAEQYFLRSLRIRELIKDTAAISNSYQNLASCYNAMGQNDKARDFLFRGLAIRKKLNYLFGLASTYESLCDLFYTDNQLETAIRYGDSALYYAKAANSTKLVMQVSYLLYKCYSKKNDPAQALKYHVLFIKAREESNDQELKRATMKIQMEHDFEEKEQLQKAEQLAQKIKFEEKATQQRIIIISVIAILLTVLLFSLVLYNRFRQIKIQKQIIEEQKGLVETKNKDILDSLNYAQRIQQVLLVSEKELAKSFSDSFILFRPKDIVSGDFYWSLNTENGPAILTADCTGHGVPGAFMSLLGISFLDHICRDKKITRPDLVFNELRDELIHALNPEKTIETKDGMDAVLCLFDLKKMKLFAALSNNSVWVIRGNEVIELPADKMPIGKTIIDNVPFSLRELILEKGDCVYTFTDGFADQFGGPKGKKLKYKNLKELLLENKALPFAEQKKKLNEAFENWKGSLEQVDDVCVIGVKIF